MNYITCLAATIFFPFFIIGIWRKRPLWSFFLATISLFILAYLTSVIKIMDWIAVWGTSDPILGAHAAMEFRRQSYLIFLFTLPLLFVFQRLMLHRDKK